MRIRIYRPQRKREGRRAGVIISLPYGSICVRPILVFPEREYASRLDTGRYSKVEFNAKILNMLIGNALDKYIKTPLAHAHRRRLT